MSARAIARRALSAAVALGCAAVGFWLASRHPLSPVIATAAFGLTTLMLAVDPLAWLVALPALMPWAGLAPWTGWLMADEFDLVVLAVASGGWALVALRAAPRVSQPPPALPTTARLLLLAWTVAAAWAAWRGVSDAGSTAFDLQQGYADPTNALRLLKPTLALWLLLPLWQRSQAPGDAQTGTRAAERLLWGMTLGHLGAALACVWERATYVGLLNFSTDYRSTGSFWEMHVGGAALDGWLALSLPFALLQLRRARRPATWALAAATVVIGGYAALTTFSRIMLLAVPLGAVAALSLGRAFDAVPDDRGPTPTASTPGAPGLASLGGLVVLVVLGGGWLFGAAGYRGMLALFGSAALLLVLGPRLVPVGCKPRPPSTWRGAAGVVAALAAAATVSSLATTKAAYVVDALALLATAGLLAATGRRPGWTVAAAAAWLVSLVGLVWVAGHWGGEVALFRALALALALALVLVACLAARRPLWPADLRRQGGAIVGLSCAAALISVFGGGSYLGGRLAQVGPDEQGRALHWRSALRRLDDGSALWLGRGSGRFLAWHTLDASEAERAGDLRVVQTAEGAEMRMLAGHFDRGWGEVLRLSQSVLPPPTGRIQAGLMLQLHKPTRIGVEVCHRHLLYRMDCIDREFDLADKAGQWQALQIDLGVAAAGEQDAWPLRRDTVFSVYTTSAEQPVALRELSLTDSTGAQLLANPRFARGTERWFSSSDHHHQPWHAKNLALHLLFEQGLLGLLLFALMAAGGLWRTALGAARHHPLAPALVGAQLGFLAVGLVDSLLDIPRLAAMALWLIGIALCLPMADNASGRERNARAG